MKSLIRRVSLDLSPALVKRFKRRRARHESFSQFGEDVVLWSLLKQKRGGVYVDCGAFDPFIHSNTAMFYEAGWSGINIEPQQERWNIFQKLRPRDINLCEVVSNIKEPVDFFESSVPTMSGIDQRFSSKHPGTNVVRTPITLSEILDEHLQGSEIDFMSIDCEGHDLSVIQSNNWSLYRPRYMVAEDHQAAEHTGISEIDKFLAGVGYEMLIQLGPSKIFRLLKDVA